METAPLFNLCLNAPFEAPVSLIPPPPEKPAPTGRPPPAWAGTPPHVSISALHGSRNWLYKSLEKSLFIFDLLASSEPFLIPWHDLYQQTGVNIVVSRLLL